ncbi:MAG: YdcF family protein [Myxococcota bacterium]
MSARGGGAREGREAVVVLGAAVWPGGVPSHALRRRVLFAVELAMGDALRDLLLTGGVGREPPSEARVMSGLASEAGIDAGRIVLEERATSTYESARFCAEIVRREGFARVTVVTDAYHLPRALLAFAQAGIAAEGAAPQESPGSLGSPAQRRRERWATAWYRLRGALRSARSDRRRD